MAAFFPVIRESQGIVLQPVFSGIMFSGVNVEFKLHESLSASLGGHYFFRTDSTSFSDPELIYDTYSLGAEFSASLYWVPFSDLSLSLTSGIYLPQTGTAMCENAKLRWSLSLGMIFSL
jgi:hypothetical protein